MSVCCQKSSLCSNYFDTTFSTNVVTNGIFLFVGMSAICSNSITSLSAYSRVHKTFDTPSESDF